MSEGRPASLSLALAAGAFAALAGLWVALRPADDHPLRAGMEAPDFGLVDLEGRGVRLSELRGRVVFVNFWATWCAPCREEAPALERLYRRLGGEGFEVLAISIDEGDSAPVEEFLDEFELSFPVLLDPERRVYADYQATGVPETFLVDARGRLSERFVGPRDWDQPRYARAVERLLAAETP